MEINENIPHVGGDGEEHADDEHRPEQPVGCVGANDAPLVPPLVDLAPDCQKCNHVLDEVHDCNEGDKRNLDLVDASGNPQLTDLEWY
jgi:hypothetical protein